MDEKDSKNGDPHDTGKEKKWSSLFGVRPLVKSGLPEVKYISDPVTGVVAIYIPYKLVDLTVSGLAMTLVGRFAGFRPNIDVVRNFMRKWVLKGQVDVAALPRVFLPLLLILKKT